MAESPPGVDDQDWVYELCRFLIAECNKLIVGFLFDAPPCSASTCPEMRASEWQFLCSVHEQPKSCCAIDYCCHTLDWAANVVTDPRTFPSRFPFLNEVSEERGLPKPDPPPTAQAISKSLINVFRRVHRIFAHAWYQHRSVFWAVEAQSGLYLLFKRVCDCHNLLPGESYRLPPEAEGLESGTTATSHTAGSRNTDGMPAAYGLGRNPRRGGGGNGGSDEDPHHLGGVGRSNTRRHIKSNPSTGSAVATVLESDEEDGSTGQGRARRGREKSSTDTEAADGAAATGAAAPLLETHDESEEAEGVNEASLGAILETGIDDVSFGNVDKMEASAPSQGNATETPSVTAQDEKSGETADDDAKTTILDEDAYEDDESTVMATRRPEPKEEATVETSAEASEDVASEAEAPAASRKVKRQESGEEAFNREVESKEEAGHEEEEKTADNADAELTSFEATSETIPETTIDTESETKTDAKDEDEAEREQHDGADSPNSEVSEVPESSAATADEVADDAEAKDDRDGVDKAATNSTMAEEPETVHGEKSDDERNDQADDENDDKHDTTVSTEG